MTLHTPTPWLYEHSPLGSNVYVDKYKAAIATGHSYSYPESGPSRDERIANVDFIVRACNAHDGLLAALREIVDRHDVLDHLQLVRIASAAIAKDAAP